MICARNQFRSDGKWVRRRASAQAKSVAPIIAVTMIGAGLLEFEEADGSALIDMREGVASMPSTVKRQRIIRSDSPTRFLVTRHRVHTGHTCGMGILALLRHSGSERTTALRLLSN